MKNAARAWGYPETENENGFDPVVSLLRDAIKAEQRNVFHELPLLQARVMERLVQLLSPDVLTGALPAHAVARALPAEEAAALFEETQFYAPLTLPSSGEGEKPAVQEAFFSPTGAFQLNRASVRFMACGNCLYKMADGTGKELVSRSGTGLLPPSTLWLGIDEPGICLHNSSFFFDLRNEANRQLFYHHLPKATWSYDDVPLKPVAGYGNREICGETVDVEEWLRGDDRIGGKIRKRVNAFYKPRFITLYDKEAITAEKEHNAVPEIIARVFGGKEAAPLTRTPLRWVCVSFPEVVSNGLLQDVNCMMNCFPVVNRKLHRINYRLQEFINIIPLKTDELFLYLQDVTDDEGNPLAAACTSAGGSRGTMLMRSGVGRFDERDAASALDHLLRLLRDESAAFSALDKDFVNGEVKQLQQGMARLTQKLHSGPVYKTSSPYLVINTDPKMKGRSLAVTYWSTSGEVANALKAGTALQLYKGGPVQNNTTVLVTPANGGRDPLSPAEKVAAYQSALLSKDRLLTVEDIKAFCHYQLGDKAKTITVQKGVVMLPGLRQGYKRTLDVTATLHPKAYDDAKEESELHGFWQENLTRLLQEKSGAFVQYRVTVERA